MEFIDSSDFHYMDAKSIIRTIFLITVVCNTHVFKSTCQKIDIDNFFCAADVNINGIVNVEDFNIFSNSFGQFCSGCREDIDKSGFVDVHDFNRLSNLFWNCILKDIDGNCYEIALIGDQLWMAENLKVTRFPDGTVIPLLEDIISWSNLAHNENAFCYYDNSIINKSRFGALYNWSAVMYNDTTVNPDSGWVQGICPDGWHLPGDGDWKQLEIYLGMSLEDANATGQRGTDEGGEMKESDTLNWFSPNTGATNSSGFSALPAGYRDPAGIFLDMSFNAGFWTSSEFSIDYAWYRGLDNHSSQVNRLEDINKSNGLSVRCIKDIYLPVIITKQPESLSKSPGETAFFTIEATGTAITYQWKKDGYDLSDGDHYSGTTSDSLVIYDLVRADSGIYQCELRNPVDIVLSAPARLAIPLISFTCGTSTVLDNDSNEYHTVQVGSQCWLKENLKVTHSRDGTPLSYVTSNSAWVSLGDFDTAYCYMQNSLVERDKYGALYTWGAAMVVCPSGWHLPSDAEWKQMEMFLGMSQKMADTISWRGVDEGGKLKETGTIHWSSPNTGATNISGFTALPGGLRSYQNGYFSGKGTNGYFWTATKYSTNLKCVTPEPETWMRNLKNSRPDINRDPEPATQGFSVRCIRD